MKRIIITSLIVMMVLSLGVALAGNGAPSGPHFNLNLIGVKEGHEKNMEDCDSGHRIFVKLGEPKGKNPLPNTTNINLVEAPDDVTFAVIDCDGTDGDASFMLPNPDPGKANTTAYSVWVRALGSPKGEPSATMQTCATECLERDIDGDCISFGDLVCSTEIVEVTRSKGKQSFTDVTRELLTMCVWVWDPVAEEWNLERRYLFDDEYENFYWKYDNNGVKLLQLRFYYEEQEYSASDWRCDDTGLTPPPDPI